MEKWVAVYLDIFAKVVLLILLLLVAKFLDKIGAFAPVTINREDFPTFLVALRPVRQAQPKFTSTMIQVGELAHARGVQEDIPHRLGKNRIVRGELIGFYPTAPHPFAKAPIGYEGVVLDVGDRITLSYKSGWEKRLSNIPYLKVEVISIRESLQVPFEHRPGSLSNFVWRWRVLRKLSRRIRKLQKNENIPSPPCFMCVLSRRTARWLTVVPLRTPFPEIATTG
ncbi:unnamed protein product [Agarophyton chilense]